MPKVKVRKAVLNDADGIANVLLDFYNIEDHEEAKKIYINTRLNLSSQAKTLSMV